MAAVAAGGLGAPLAAAEADGAGGVRLEFDRGKPLRPGGAVAERLLGGFAAGAPPVGFAGFDVEPVRGCLRDQGAGSRTCVSLPFGCGRARRCGAGSRRGKRRAHRAARIDRAPPIDCPLDRPPPGPNGTRRRTQGGAGQGGRARAQRAGRHRSGGRTGTRRRTSRRAIRSEACIGRKANVAGDGGLYCCAAGQRTWLRRVVPGGRPGTRCRRTAAPSCTFHDCVTRIWRRSLPMRGHRNNRTLERTKTPADDRPERTGACVPAAGATRLRPAQCDAPHGVRSRIARWGQDRQAHLSKRPTGRTDRPPAIRGRGRESLARRRGSRYKPRHADPTGDDRGGCRAGGVPRARQRSRGATVSCCRRAATNCAGAVPRAAGIAMVAEATGLLVYPVIAYPVAAGRRDHDRPYSPVHVPPRLIVVDPGLRSALGHNLGYSVAVAQAARAQGIAPLVLASCDFQGGLPDGIPRRPASPRGARPPAAARCGGRCSDWPRICHRRWKPAWCRRCARCAGRCGGPRRTASARSWRPRWRPAAMPRATSFCCTPSRRPA